MNGDESLFSQQGVSVIGHPLRAESQVTTGCGMGEYLVVACDPAVEADRGHM
jgi:hypothetical protein